MTARFHPNDNVINVRDFGAKGDGVTDDFSAFNAAITHAMSLNAGSRPIIYVPAGNYLIDGATPLPLMYHKGIFIRGDGPHYTYVTIGPSYVGDLFSWSECWMGTSFTGPSLTPANDMCGAGVSNITVLGNTGSSSQQNAFVFYDRNDNVLVEDVEVFYLNGYAFSIGEMKNFAVAYMRESFFSNVKVFNSGTASVSAFHITSNGTGDGTNECKFYKVAIFASVSTGMDISIGSGSCTTRSLTFYDLRIEDVGTDNLVISSSGTNPVNTIHIFNYTGIGTPSGHYAANLTGSVQSYDIVLTHSTIAGPVNIDNARMVQVDITSTSTSSFAPVIMGSSAGTNIVVSGYMTAQSIENITFINDRITLGTPYLLYGMPNGVNFLGSYSLRGNASTTSAVRLTTDGLTVSAANSFHPPPGNIYQVTIMLIATDVNNKSNWFSWKLPHAVMSSAFGSMSVTAISDISMGYAGTGSGCSVSLTADTTNDCPDLSFTPPSGNTDTWDISARFDFVMVS